MAVSHIYNQTVADGTATSVVRPSDWNSVHNQFMTLAGNTVGQSTVSGSNIVFQGGNNVTLSQIQGAGVGTILISGANTVAQTVDTNKAGTGFTSTSTGGVAIVGTNNTNGLSLGIPNFLTTAQPVGAYLTTAAQSSVSNVSGVIAGTNATGGTATLSGNVSFSNANGVSFYTSAGNAVVATVATNYQSQGAYLTTARASNDGVGLNTALTANGVSWTVNSSGISLNVPAFLTTAAQSNHSHNFATTTTNGSLMVVATTNSNGATVAVPPYITTYVAQTTQTQPAGNIAGVGTSGTNVTMTLNSNGLALSVGGGGVTNQTGPNIAVAGSTVTSGDVLFSNANGVTFGMAGSTVTASVNAGGAATISAWEPYPPIGGGVAFSTMGLNTIYLQKVIPPINVAFSNVERRMSGSFVSSTNSHSCRHTYDYGLYSRGTGASTSIYSQIGTSQLVFMASISSNVSAGITISQGAGSFTTTSAGTALFSLVTGYKHFYMGFGNTLTAGGEYAWAMRMSSATTVGTNALRLGLQELSVFNNLTIGKLYATTALASNASFVGDFAQAAYSATSSNLPSTIAISGLTNAVSQQRMYLQFDN